MYLSHRRSPKNLTLNKAFPNWASSGGIFSALDSDDSMPWHGAENISSVGLDISYHGSHSGAKFVAPIVYNWLDDNGAVTQAGIANLVAALKATYLQKWSHIWSLYTAEYSPLDSYDVVETMDRDLSHTIDSEKRRDDNLTERTQGDDDLTNSGTDTITDTPSGTETVEDSVYGFNSDAYSPTNKTVTTPLVVNTETNQHGHKAERDIDTTTTNTGYQTVTEDASNEDTEDYTKTRSGRMYNVPAEMLKADRDFWLDGYFSSVFDDLDEMLTLAIYSDSEVQSTIF